MAGVIQTGNFPRSLEEGLNKLFGMSYNEHEKQYTKIFDIEGSGRNFELDYQLEGFQSGVVKPEGSSVTFDAMSQGYVPKYTHKTVSLGYVVSEEMVEDEQYSIFSKGAKMLALSMNQAMEINAANVLNRAFNSSYTMDGGDGKELCATDHRRGASDSTTFSNELATPASLSEQSLEEALILIGDFRDARGNRINVKGKRLIVPTDLQYEACRILKSDLQNDTANNAINAIKASGSLMDYTVNNYLTSSTAWFIKTDCPDGLKHFDRRAVRFERDMDFGTSNYRFKASYRASDGWTDPRGIVGSAGTA